MAKQVDYDYINYLAEKWWNYLLKKDQHDPARKAQYQKVEEMINEMKHETETGIMLYNYFIHIHSNTRGELEAYKKYLEGGSV
mgnify:CR=1 FL=1